MLGIHANGDVHICDIDDPQKQRYVINEFIHRLEPVTIDKEILNRLGYLENPDKYYAGKDVKTFSVAIINRGKTVAEIPVKYVHELQNVYSILKETDLI